MIHHKVCTNLNEAEGIWLLFRPVRYFFPISFAKDIEGTVMGQVKHLRTILKAFIQNKHISNVSQ